MPVRGGPRRYNYVDPLWHGLSGKQLVDLQQLNLLRTWLKFRHGGPAIVAWAALVDVERVGSAPALAALPAGAGAVADTEGVIGADGTELAYGPGISRRAGCDTDQIPACAWVGAGGAGPCGAVPVQDE